MPTDTTERSVVKRTKYVVIHESVAVSIIKDCVTFAVLIGAMFIAHWLNMPGVVVVVIALIALAALGSRERHMTPQEARDWLNREFPE